MRNDCAEKIVELLAEPSRDVKVLAYICDTLLDGLMRKLKR